MTPGSKRVGKYVFWGGCATVGFFLFSILMGSFYTIEQGDRGVVLRNGALTAVVEPGLHWKWPVIDEIKEMSIRTQKVVFNEVLSYSKDVQAADLRISVNYRLDASKVDYVFTRFGLEYVDRLITPNLPKYAKEVFGQFQAAQVVSDRSKLGIETEEALRTVVGAQGIFIEGVQIENVDFSEAYESAIETAMQAEAEVKKVRQELQRQLVEADKVRADAAGEADARVLKAEADAAAIKLRGNAEAEAIKVRGDALRANPDLVALVTAERWDGILPTSMIPGGAVPFLNVGESKTIQ